MTSPLQIMKLKSLNRKTVSPDYINSEAGDDSQILPFQIAYVIRLAYPDPSAAAGQAIQMATAFSKVAQSVDFYVHGVQNSEASVRAQYPGVADSPMRIRNMEVTRLPGFLYSNGISRFTIFNSMVAAGLLWHGSIQKRETQHNTLFVRSRLEFMYWGLMRRYLPWLRKWTFIYEAHDVASLNPKAALEDNPFELRDGPEGRRRQRTLRALRNFDLVVCVTQALADDLKRWSNGRVQPEVVRHASGLLRLPQSPAPHLSSERVVLGYVGTIDQYRGVDTLISTMRHLPERFVLRLVGRIPERTSDGKGPAWLDDLLNDQEVRKRVELVPPVPVSQVADEIDRCDVLLQPASDDVISLRYRAPLKLFDYMVRGKPIVAADVPCHKEMLTDGDNAVLYRHGDAKRLAERIKMLADRPALAEAVARSAWEQGADFTYDARARRILGLADEVRMRREARRSALL